MSKNKCPHYLKENQSDMMKGVVALKSGVDPNLNSTTVCCITLKYSVACMTLDCIALHKTSLHLSTLH
jgi:hypothetical protein